MPKKKIIRAEDITPEDILSLYDEVLPLLFNNPEGIDSCETIRKFIRRHVQADWIHHIMEDPAKPLGRDMRSNMFLFSNSNSFSTVFLTAKTKQPKKAFDETVEEAFRNAIKAQEDLFAESPLKFYYHRIISYDHPRIAIGFFRRRNKSNDNAFTENELRVLQRLMPHLLLLYRTVLGDTFRSVEIQYFTVLNSKCFELSRKFKLSDIEVKLLPEILSGLTNEEIAGKHFVTVAAIKKHLNHIFKKTDSKNRVDFISKFFTSPKGIAS